MECEILHSANHHLNLPPLPLGKRRIVAVKRISIACPNDQQNQLQTNRVLDDPRQECAVAGLLAANGGHRNVVASYFHFHEHQCLYMVGEFCTDGDFVTHLTTTTRNGVMDERQSIRIMKQILAGVDYLHRQLGIAHRDLSLENVLTHNGECKISDFGLSVDASVVCVERVGKEYYMALEVVAGAVYDPVKADRYLVTGHHVVHPTDGIAPRITRLSSQQSVPGFGKGWRHQCLRVVESQLQVVDAVDAPRLENAHGGSM